MHYSARHRWTLIVCALAASFLTAAIFAMWLQHSGNWMNGLGWERTLLLRMDRDVPLVLDLALLSIPWFGTHITLMPINLIVCFWLWRSHHRLDLVERLLVLQIGSLLLNALVKYFYGRPRPDLWEHRGQFQWSSYPSGHAIVGVSFLGTVAILLHQEKGWRWPLFTVPVLVLFNCYSRLYLGVHWPTDVIGGLIIGFVWLGGTMIAYRKDVAAGVRD